LNAEPQKNIEILLVEDSPADVIITREAFAEFKIINSLHVVDDGVNALAYLHRTGQYTNVPRPDLILLDLNLPRKNGREVLAEIKADLELKSIPVVVLTTSHAEKDIMEAYDQHANCYIVKPVGFTNFVEAIKSIRHFWFSVVTLPPEANNGQDLYPGSAD
jgi:two-component system, chemotaxis family, response regulator Rcp1